MLSSIGGSRAEWLNGEKAKVAGAYWMEYLPQAIADKTTGVTSHATIRIGMVNNGRLNFGAFAKVEHNQNKCVKEGSMWTCRWCPGCNQRDKNSSIRCRRCEQIRRGRFPKEGNTQSFCSRMPNNKYKHGNHNHQPTNGSERESIPSHLKYCSFFPCERCCAFST